MKRLLILVLLAGPAAAQEAPVPLAALRACLDAANRAPEAERACVGGPSAACMAASAAGDTTIGMTDCTMAEAGAWDALLNETYESLRAMMQAVAEAEAAAGAAPAPQQDLLRDAQRAWLAFRDADCAQEVAHWGDGSMRQIAGAQCMRDRTATRTFELREKRRVFEAP